VLAITSLKYAVMLIPRLHLSCVSYHGDHDGLVDDVVLLDYTGQAKIQANRENRQMTET
jgi:hypothetical protein